MPFAIKGYKISGKIGEGNMGTVYSAKQLAIGREVAIKVLKKKVAEKRQNIDKFIRETRTAAMLNHRNIVTGRDVGAANNKYYFIMEMLPNGDLAEFINKNGDISEEKAINWLKEMAEALKHAKKHNVIHCDIKPANIMLDSNGIIKLTDLGLTQIADESSTDKGKVEGTPHYIAPEQLTRKETLDTRTDIYSLGATSYHLVSGTPPFSGKSSKEIAIARLRGNARKLSEIIPSISEEFSNLIEKMMKREKSDRPENPDMLIRMIDKLKASKKNNRSEKTTTEIKIAKVRPRVETSKKANSHIKTAFIVTGVILLIALVAYLSS